MQVLQQPAVTILWFHKALVLAYHSAVNWLVPLYVSPELAKSLCRRGGRIGPPQQNSVFPGPYSAPLSHQTLLPNGKSFAIRVWPDSEAAVPLAAVWASKALLSAKPSWAMSKAAQR